MDKRRLNTDAKEYDSILKEYDSNLEAFRHNVEAQQAFYFLGYKVITKGNVVTLRVTPKRRARLAEAKEAVLMKEKREKCYWSI